MKFVYIRSFILPRSTLLMYRVALVISNTTMCRGFNSEKLGNYNAAADYCIDIFVTCAYLCVRISGNIINRKDQLKGNCGRQVYLLRRFIDDGLYERVIFSQNW